VLIESVGSGLSGIENRAVLISRVGVRGITWVVAFFAMPGCCALPWMNIRGVSEVCYSLVILREIFALVFAWIALEQSPKMDLGAHRIPRVIEGEGDPQGKPSEKVINGHFMRVSEDFKEYGARYLGEVSLSPAGEW